MEAIVNKVANSGIITLDLEALLPSEEIIIIDLKDYLFMQMILKEKDFREQLKNKDWQQYHNKNVSISCSADAIIPLWAYMLITSYLQPVANAVYYGDVQIVKNNLLLSAIANLDVSPYTDARIVVKGCGQEALPESAYIAITNKLLPIAKSIMYGEPCSTVPIYKRKA